MAAESSRPTRPASKGERGNTVNVARGRLIALEGIDGCGKSLQALRLRDALEARGYPAQVFREPGDTPYGRELRRIFVEGRDVAPEEEVRLFLEDRRIDVRDNIEPALARGEMVVMDRYYLSSVVYQGALGVDPVWIRTANEEIAPIPDLTLVLDLDPATARARIQSARGGTNTFEEHDYLASVRALYRGYCEEDTIDCVDADRSPEAVHLDLLDRVERLLVAWTRAPSDG